MPLSLVPQVWSTCNPNVYSWQFADRTSIFGCTGRATSLKIGEKKKSSGVSSALCDHTNRMRKKSCPINCVVCVGFCEKCQFVQFFSVAFAFLLRVFLMQSKKSMGNTPEKVRGFFEGERHWV